VATLEYVDLAISTTPVADRCIKSSTQPCNLHRETLAVEWPYSRAQWFSTWHRHRIPCLQQVSSSNFGPAEAARSTVSAVIVKWIRLGGTTAQLRSGRPHNLTEQYHWVLKHVGHKNCLTSVAALTTEFQTASGSNVSTRTVHQEFHEMDFHGRAAAHKPKITMNNFVATVWGRPFPLSAWQCPRAQSEVHTWFVEELHWLAQSPDFNPIEHRWDELERQLWARPNRPTSQAQ
jgi:hypothetical protein